MYKLNANSNSRHRAGNRKSVHALSVVALLAISGTIALPAHAAPCYDVTFSFTNLHSSGTSIKVKKVKYYDRTSAKWRTENVADRTCAYGNTCKTDGDDLGGLTEPVQGHDIKSIKYLYSYTEVDGDWSDATWSDKFYPSDQECRNDRNYGAATITG